MSRARNIKPGFYKNEDLAECSIWARFIFPGLWMLADREGRLEDRPKRIKGELLPFDSQDAEPLLVELAARGFIERYEVEGRAYIQITAFSKHQNPHHREAESDIPPPQSPRLLPHATNNKPEALPTCKEHKARGKPEASPRLDPPKSDLEGGVNPADSLIPDSLIPDSGFSDSLIPEAAASTADSVRDEKSDTAAADPIQVRSIELATLLRKRGAALQASDPRVIAWAAGGISDAQALTALETAQQRRHEQGNAQPINAGYLDAILKDFLNPPTQAKPGRKSIHDERADTIAQLTGANRNDRTATAERDITGESVRVA